jgi:hypothetical protein
MGITYQLEWGIELGIAWAYIAQEKIAHTTPFLFRDI